MRAPHVKCLCWQQWAASLSWEHFLCSCQGLGTELQTNGLFLHFLCTKKIAPSSNRRSQKAKLPFARPNPRGVCWKTNSEWSVCLISTFDFVFHPQLPPGWASLGETISLALLAFWWEVWGKFCSFHPDVRYGGEERRYGRCVLSGAAGKKREK